MKAHRVVFGIIVVAIGVLWWLSNRGLVAFDISFGRDWPVIIIAIGLMSLVEGLAAIGRGKRVFGRISGGMLVCAIGVWVWLSNLGVPGVSFSRNWPLLIVLAGLHIVFSRLRRRRHTSRVRWTRRERETDSDVLSELEDGKIDVEAAINRIRGK